MFSITLSLLITFYISVPLLILFTVWFFFEVEKKHWASFQMHNKKQIVCPYCLNVFFEEQTKTVTQCCLCECFIDLLEEKKKNVWHTF